MDSPFGRLSKTGDDFETEVDRGSDRILDGGGAGRLLAKIVNHLEAPGQL